MASNINDIKKNLEIFIACRKFYEDQAEECKKHLHGKQVQASVPVSERGYITMSNYRKLYR